jgi:hypothetical protein
VDTSAYRHQESITIDRTPNDLFDLIADVSKMGRWSPVCTGGAYDADGEWFTGTNAMGDATWETRCRVVAADRGREFAFINHGLEGRVEMVRWGFELRAVEGGATEVTQTWQVLPDYGDGLGLNEAETRDVLEMMRDAALEGMPRTLAALKADAEATSSAQA